MKLVSYLNSTDEERVGSRVGQELLDLHDSARSFPKRTNREDGALANPEALGQFANHPQLQDVKRENV